MISLTTTRIFSAISQPFSCFRLHQLLLKCQWPVYPLRQLRSLQHMRSRDNHTPALRQCRKAKAVLSNDSYLRCARCLGTASSNASSSSEFLCQQLKHRRVLRIVGADSAVFLQGLVTNDVNVLTTGDHEASGLYAMMLNVQGRVLYDLILYRLKSNPDCVFIECNADIAIDLLKILSKYKLRKKFTLSDVSEEVNVWAVLTKESSTTLTHEPISISLSNVTRTLLCLPDPRLKSFGFRLLLQPGIEGSSIVLNSSNVDDVYDNRRYQIGLSEGTKDLPPGECLPLESNLVFLNGVSFDKGCYVGQELTARTQYTGVIRKRLMPVISSSEISAGQYDGMTVETSAGKACGKIRSFTGRHGIGLLRVQEVAGKGLLSVKSQTGEIIGKIETFIPNWWHSNSDEVLKKTVGIVAETEKSNQ